MRKTSGISLWKDIRKGWEEFNHRIAIQVKNVARQNFRGMGGWVGGNCLKEAFPLLFSLASQKNAIVANMWDGRGSGGQWVHFKRPFQYWEMEGVS